MTAIYVSTIICATVLILFIVACIYDYKMKTADIRRIERFEKAFKNSKTVFIPNPEINHRKEPAPDVPADSGESLDFPNSNSDSLSKYH